MGSSRFKTLRIAGLVLAAVLVASGCASQRAWKYGPEPDSALSVVSPVSVAVPPFKDERENDNSNMWLMYMIPLLPYGWQTYETPEGPTQHLTSGLWIWKPNEDFAKAAAAEFQAAHIFKEAFFSYRQSEGQLVLEGRVHSTGYYAKIFSYCLSFAGPYLWFIGAPSSHVTNKIELTLALKEIGSGKVLWEKKYTREDSSLIWIYYLPSDFNYSEILKEILIEAVKDLRGALSGKAPAVSAGPTEEAAEGG